MKILYLDCNMGVAGDMLAAALIELLPNQTEFIDKFNSLGIPNTIVSTTHSSKCGIIGTHFSVSINGEEERPDGEGHSEHHHNHNHHNHHQNHHHHHHSSMHDIEHIISHLNLQTDIKQDILAIYSLIADAESEAHGVPVSEVHFHEVGSLDAIADITAVCLLMSMLNPDRVIASPIDVGSGTVKCAHGIIPVPAPATANLLKGIPIFSGDIKSELCTPTGAALIKYFASEFGEIPAMTTSSIGYGMGTKDFGRANLLRAFIGETDDSIADTVIELSCNLDDMTAEATGFAMDILFDNGALDVYTISIGMKKSRPGILLKVLCKETDRHKMLNLIFKHTSTIGVRETLMHRHILNRKTEILNTPYGDIRKKISYGYGVNRIKHEYDDMARIAKENDISIAEVENIISKL